MSLTENGNGLVMPVGPMYGNGANGMGWGDGLFWIIVLFLFAFMSGNGCGGFGGGSGAMVNADVQRGFDQQSVMSGVGAIQSSLASLAQGQCNGFANAESAAASRQMASMQQNWNMQTALDGRLDSLAMAQQQGLCENRAAIADVKYAIAMDGAQTRANTDAKVQNVMDKFHQLEMDGMKQNYENRIANMQSQIDALQGLVNNANRDVALANEVDALYNRLNSCPVPTTPVYGRTPIFTCGGNGMAVCGGCGGNTGFVA